MPRYLDAAGFEIVPVPVYYPEVTYHPRQAGLPEARRRSRAHRPRRRLSETADLEAHFEDIVAKRPSAIWLQSGIRDDAFAERIAAAGIDVVQDRCLMVEHKRWALGRQG